MIYVGVDWAEDHHDICVMDSDGAVLAKRRIPDSVSGVGELHALVAQHAEEDGGDEEVVIGIEIDRGLLVGSLVAAGYAVANLINTRRSPSRRSAFASRSSVAVIGWPPGVDLQAHHRPALGHCRTGTES